MTKTFPEIQLGSTLLAIDAIAGHGAESARFVTRRVGANGKAGRKSIIANAVPREQIAAYAIDLLELCELMVDGAAYTTTDALPQPGRARIGSIRADAVKRHARLRDRLPLLMLAQRVIERADDEVTSTLLALLANMEATGKTPIRAVVDFHASEACPDNGHPIDAAGGQAPH